VKTVQEFLPEFLGYACIWHNVNFPSKLEAVDLRVFLLKFSSGLQFFRVKE
jgi:hypothetical protein